MDLIVVESPTKAKTLSRFLGENFAIEATMGHIKDLPKSKLGVDTDNNFKPLYEVVAKRSETIGKIISKSKKAKVIYLATDPDREGEAIAQHVKEILQDMQKEKRDKNVLRITFHEITKDAVEEAIKNPKSVNRNLVDAQIARRVLDRLVGYKLSPLLWKKVRRGLSAGRVQTVAVRLIVEREREIDAFKTEEYWEIFSEVQTTKDKGQSFLVKLVKIDDKPAEIKNGKLAKEIVSDLEKSNYKVADVKKREVVKKPYAPFTTSTMTQTAARFFGWSAKKTMSVAQSLYEEGLITYHRTDSTNISEEAIKKTREFVKKTYGDKYLPESARIYKTKSKVAQEAHEAIRPTEVQMTNDKLQMTNGKFANDGRILYGVIWKRFVASQMSTSVFDETTIDVLAEQMAKGKGQGYLLRASGQVMKFDGWRKVVPLAKDEEPELPIVEKDEILKLLKVDPQQKFTQPPARFNEASLIKTLEKLGIGRPSTYAPIITTIQIRQYVEKDEGKFTPTPIGAAVVDFMVSNFPDVFEYSFTAGMEADLDNVANGQRDWRDMMKIFWKPFEKKMEDVEKNAKRIKIEAEKLGRKCPKCKDGELIVRIGRFGKFVSCSRFPNCDFTDKYQDRIGMDCPECKKGHVVIKITGKGRKFFGCSRYPECKYASWTNPKLKGHKPEEKTSEVKTLN